MECRATLTHFFGGLDEETAVVAVCGARKSKQDAGYSKDLGKVKESGQHASNPGPLLDEWLLADFALFHHLLQHHPGPQVWLTDINMNEYCQSSGPLLHGPPSQSNQQVVFEYTNPPFYTITRTSKLCSTFRGHLNSALATSSRVLVIICAHGFPEYGGYVLLGKNKFRRSDFEVAVPTRSVGGAVTLLSTACHSGHFLSPRWTTFCSVPMDSESVSSSRPASFHHRGGPWCGAFAETTYTHGRRTTVEFGVASQEATIRIKTNHPPPDQLIVPGDQREYASRILAAEVLPGPAPQPLPANTGDGGRTAGGVKNLETLVAEFLNTQYPHPDAPSNHYLHGLLSRYQANCLHPSGMVLLANALRQRQGDDAHAMDIIGRLGIIPELSVQDWTQDLSLFEHPYWGIVSGLVNTYQGFKYRKPMLYVMWVCERESVSEDQLRRAVEGYELCRSARRRGRGRRRRGF